jgi:hypothetical protein
MGGYYKGNLESKIVAPRLVTAKWMPNGSSAIVAGESLCKGCSVVYTSTGLFTITFDEVHVNLLAYGCELLEGTVTGNKLEFATIVPASKTATVGHLVEDGSPALADIAHATGTYCTAWFLFGDSESDT